MSEYSGTSTKKGRGLGKQSLTMIKAMHEIAAELRPITGRGVGYRLFVRKLIPDMGTKSMKVVYRCLKEARERGMIPWPWIVDETRALERVASWEDPEHFADSMVRGYRRDAWNLQPVRVEVWSEKGTVRGLLGPVLDEYGVGFRVMHGFTSSTVLYGVSQDRDGRDLNVLYVGDYDPSGMCMSEHDIPTRLAEYGGAHIKIKRVALLAGDTTDIPGFPASDKKKDTRYPWFVQRYGTQCWELDAMNPNDLRARVELEIRNLIDLELWHRCVKVQDAEHDSLLRVMKRWGARRNRMADRILEGESEGPVRR